MKSNRNWNKLSEETSKQYEAFCIYRDLGPNRSILKVAQKRSGSGGFSKLKEWSIKYDWVERAAAYDEHVDKLRRTSNEEAIIEMSARHADYSVKIQEKAIDALGVIKPDQLKPHELIKWLDVAVKIERLSRGVPTENIKREEIKGVDTDFINQENLRKPEVRRKANQLIKAIADSQSSTDGVSTDSQ